MYHFVVSVNWMLKKSSSKYRINISQSIYQLEKEKRRGRRKSTNRVSLVVVEAVVTSQGEPSPHPLVRARGGGGFPPQVSGTKRRLVVPFLGAGPGHPRREHVARPRHLELKDVGSRVREPHHLRMGRVHHAFPVHRHYDVADFEARALRGRVGLDRGNDHRFRAVDPETELPASLPPHHHPLVALCKVKNSILSFYLKRE